MKPLCIYHGNCVDGFGAAWCVREAYRLVGEEIDFHAGVYGDPPPDVTDRSVIMVDFSYKRPVLEKMLETVRRLLILDHHKTAAEELSFLPSTECDFRVHGGGPSKVYKVFDMDRSGAGIAWDFFFPETPRPVLINHIEDRDLWRFNLPKTREIQAAVFSYPFDFDVWDGLMFGADTEELALEGIAILRQHDKDIKELLPVVTMDMMIGGHKVPIANLPYVMVSDAAHILAKGKPFAGCFWDTPKGRVFGLRSLQNGIDVSEIAKQYGGGGHERSAGFRMAYDQLEQFVVSK